MTFNESYFGSILQIHDDPRTNLLDGMKMLYTNKNMWQMNGDAEFLIGGRGGIITNKYELGNLFLTGTREFLPKNMKITRVWKLQDHFSQKKESCQNWLLIQDLQKRVKDLSIKTRFHIMQCASVSFESSSPKKDLGCDPRTIVTFEDPKDPQVMFVQVVGSRIVIVTSQVDLTKQEIKVHWSDLSSTPPSAFKNAGINLPLTPKAKDFHLIPANTNTDPAATESNLPYLLIASGDTGPGFVKFYRLAD
jgi:hypothetical protein